MNGYFRLVNDADKTSIKLIPPTDGDKPLDINDVVEYMTMKNYACDLPTLRRAVEKAAETENVLLLEQTGHYKERGCCKFTIAPDKMSVYAKFYAASEGGEEMSAEEIAGDLQAKGVRYGIRHDAIEQFVRQRQYCEDILVAEGTPPVQGQDAYIEYHFNTDKKAKPTLNEDGSVDFFHLNILNHCNKGDVLAVLHPEVPGEDGENVFGERLKPAEVKKETFRFGNHIELSEDGLTLTSLVNGHGRSGFRLGYAGSGERGQFHRQYRV